MCGGGVCVGGGGRAFYYTYIYSSKGQSCEGTELVGVLVAETIHPACMCGEEEEEEEDLFVFNDTIEGPRAPAVKPGRVTQA